MMPSRLRRSNTPDSMEASLLYTGVEDGWSQHVEHSKRATRPEDPHPCVDRIIYFERFSRIRARLERERQRTNDRGSASYRSTFSRSVGSSLRKIRMATSRTTHRIKDFLSSHFAALGQGLKRRKYLLSGQGSKVDSRETNPRRDDGKVDICLREAASEAPQHNLITPADLEVESSASPLANPDMNTIESYGNQNQSDTRATNPSQNATREAWWTPPSPPDEVPFRWTRAGYRETGDAELIFGDSPIPGYQQEYHSRPAGHDLGDYTVDVQIGTMMELTLTEFEELVGHGAL